VLYGIPTKLKIPGQDAVVKIPVPENLKGTYRKLVNESAPNPATVLRIAGLEK
jgi:hypothetical protein